MKLDRVLNANVGLAENVRALRSRARAHALRVGLVLASTLVTASIAAAFPLGYSVRSDATTRDIYRIDLASGAATQLGPSGFSKIEALAMSPTGELFGVNPQSAQLVRCNTSTGACTAIGTLSGIPSASTNAGLAFDSTGRLFLSMNAVLYSVNPSSAATTVLGSSGAAISGLASRSATSNCASGLFGIGGNSDQGRFYCLNTTNGSATLLGSLSGIGALDGGLDSDSRTGFVWGLTNETPGRTYAVDPVTLAVSNIRTVTVNDQPTGGFESLAVAPSPEETVSVPVAPLPYLIGVCLTLLGLSGFKLRGSRRHSR
jgi:hypothetical protein